MTRRIVRVLACLAVAGLVSSCGLFGSDDSDGRTRLELFQFKPEAVQTFEEIIAGFEREHPDIDVYQNHVPDADTVLRTRLVREDIPDLMTLNAGASWSELASAGVFYDFSGEPVVQQVSPAILEILNDLGTANDGEVNGAPSVAGLILMRGGPSAGSRRRRRCLRSGRSRRRSRRRR
jgi:raffinose/stachyose/melibiose transport system substrate-binding protein